MLYRVDAFGGVIALDFGHWHEERFASRITFVSPSSSLQMHLAAQRARGERSEDGSRALKVMQGNQAFRHLQKKFSFALLRESRSLS